MKVAIFGDLFVTNDVLQAALESAFAGSGIDFEYVYFTTQWPVQPVMYTDEVREFVGNENELIDLVADVEMLLTHTAPITQKVLDSAPNLKVVGAARGGPVNINWDACTARGIPVLYAPGRNSGAVAEFTVGLILAQTRNITLSHMSMVNEKRWRGDLYVYDAVGKELNSSIIGLIGLGAIGKKVVKNLSGFGSEILVHDPFVDEAEIKELGCTPVSLNELLEKSDIISLHNRSNEETKGMIGAEQIKRMKNTAYLINTARGELIDHDALYQALKEKRIAGAALDVFEAEPPPDDSPLFELENVSIATHLGGASRQAAEIGAEVLAKEVHSFIVEKKSPQYLTNPDFNKVLDP